MRSAVVLGLMLGARVAFAQPGSDAGSGSGSGSDAGAGSGSGSDVQPPAGSDAQPLPQDQPPTTLDEPPANARHIAVKGRVINALGKPIRGATVTVEGTDITATTDRTGFYRMTGEPAHPVDDKVTAAASKAFLDLVARSRGSIQKCYEQALKKRTDLQAKTVTLIVSASFSSSGAFQTSSFQPSLDAAFDACMQNIASKWIMPTNSPAMTFKAPVSLTPS